MYTHHAVIDFPTVSVPLPTDADGFFAALGRPGFVDAANGVRMGMLANDDLLASIS